MISSYKHHKIIARSNPCQFVFECCPFSFTHSLRNHDSRAFLKTFINIISSRHVIDRNPHMQDVNNNQEGNFVIIIPKYFLNFFAHSFDYEKLPSLHHFLSFSLSRFPLKQRSDMHEQASQFIFQCRCTTWKYFVGKCSERKFNKFEILRLLFHQQHS